MFENFMVGSNDSTYKTTDHKYKLNIMGVQRFSKLLLLTFLPIISTLCHLLTFWLHLEKIRCLVRYQSNLFLLPLFETCVMMNVMLSSTFSYNLFV